MEKTDMTKELRVITSWAEYKAEPEASKDILFGYGMHVAALSEKRLKLIAATVMIIGLLGAQNGLIEPSTIPAGFSGVFTFLNGAMGLGFSMLMAWYARDIWRQKKAIKWIAEELGIDVSRFDLDKLKRGN